MANWPHHNIPAVFEKEEEVGSLGVVEEKSERIVRFEVIRDYLGTIRIRRCRNSGQSVLPTKMAALVTIGGGR